VRFAALGFIALLATGCSYRGASSGSGSATSATALTIAISAGKQDRVTQVWTLRCPDQGTLPNPRRACERLEALDDPFAPVPKDVACTEVYGGPEIAVVRGRFRGQQVSAEFTRTNGCEIARWNKVRFLLRTS
jgi:subtilisin inhibitor-like